MSMDKFDENRPNHKHRDIPIMPSFYAMSFFEGLCAAESKEKYKDVKWFKENISFVAEFNKDSAWINSHMFTDLGGKIEAENSEEPYIEIMTPFGKKRVLTFDHYCEECMLEPVEEEQENIVKIAIAFHNGKLLIKEEEKDGIPVKYYRSENKAYIEFKVYQDVRHYFEYELDGLWVFEKDHDIFVGTKIKPNK